MNGYSAADMAASMLPVSPSDVSAATVRTVRRSDLGVDNGCFGTHISSMNVGGQLSELHSPSATGFPGSANASQCVYFQGAGAEFVGHGYDAGNAYSGSSNVYDAASLNLAGRVAGFSPPFDKWRRWAPRGVFRRRK